jgi:hypothetical protein
LCRNSVNPCSPRYVSEDSAASSSTVYESYAGRFRVEVTFPVASGKSKFAGAVYLSANLRILQLFETHRLQKTLSQWLKSAFLARQSLRPAYSALIVSIRHWNEKGWLHVTSDWDTSDAFADDHFRARLWPAGYAHPSFAMYRCHLLASRFQSSLTIGRTEEGLPWIQQPNRSLARGGSTLLQLVCRWGL